MGNFKTERTKESSMSTISSMLNNYLAPGSRLSVRFNKSHGGSDAPKIESIRRHTERIMKGKKYQHSVKKISKRSRRKFIKRNVEERKKIERLGKLAIGDEDTVNEVVDTNITNIQNWRGSNTTEIKMLEEEVLKARQRPSYKQLKKKKKNHHTPDYIEEKFDERVEKGIISTPGITPGLAPIGMSDDESEDSENNKSQINLEDFKDDYEEYH